MTLPPGYSIVMKFANRYIDYLSVRLVLPDGQTSVLVSVRKKRGVESYVLADILDPYVLKDLSWDEVIQQLPDTLRRTFDNYVAHVISGAK